MQWTARGIRFQVQGLVLVLAVLMISGNAWAEEKKKERPEQHAVPQPHVAPQQRAMPPQHAAPPQRARPQVQPRVAPQPHAMPPMQQPHAAPPERARPQAQPRIAPQPHAMPQQQQRHAAPPHAMPQPHAAPQPRAMPQRHAAPQPHGVPQHAVTGNPAMRAGEGHERAGQQPGPRNAAGKTVESHAKRFTPPQGAVAKPDARGGTRYTLKNGAEVHTGRQGQVTQLRTHTGAEARFTAHGRISSIHAGSLTINRGPHGGRFAETRLHGGGRVVSIMGTRRGFVERPFERAGRSYVRRTYVYGGTPYAVVYRGYRYHGIPYYAYVPHYYYAPAFYGWCYNPWAAPIAWEWGWRADPWYGHFGYYFTPFAAYSSPAFWLTDFLLAENLRVAYEAQAAANTPVTYVQQGTAAPAPPAAVAPPPDTADATPLTPEVKQAIADEVKNQLAAEKAAASNPQPAPSSEPAIPEALDPKVRTFIVSTALSEQTADGTACSLTPGDVLTRIGDSTDANQNVLVLVTSSQSADCAAGLQIPVALQDLQDMHNDFRQKIDAGLQKLASDEGKNGMSSGPAADPKPVEEGQAQPDSDAAGELTQADQAAATAETDVQQAQEGSGW